MSAHFLSPGVDDIDDLEVPDAPDEDTATIHELCEWHVNRMRWYTAKVARTEAQRDRMVERYREWCESTTAGWRRKVAESEAFVEYQMARLVDTDPKAPKTLRLPSGTVKVNAPRPSVVVDDVAAFEQWAIGRGDSSQLARWTCHPNRVEIRKVLEDGEVVDGVSLVMGERSVTVTLDDWDDE